MRYYQLGLTLVELLISVTIFSIIVAVTISIFLNTRRIEKRLEIDQRLNQEICLFMKNLSKAICRAKKIIQADQKSLEIISQFNDTIRYYLKDNLLYRNEMPFSSLRIDSLFFTYMKVSSPSKGNGFLEIDKNCDGILKGDELDSIYGVGFKVFFLDTDPRKKIRRTAFLRLKTLSSL